MVRTISKTHSYEELRGVVIDILIGTENTFQDGNYANLVVGVANVLVKRGAPYNDNHLASPGGVRMQPTDVELVRDIFWDLFRQGIITLGRDENASSWPWFRVSHHARETLLKKSPYRFHDVASYLKLVRNEAVDISDAAVSYLEEAIATYYADCLLASCVMVGVAAEVEFIRMIEQGAKNALCGVEFAAAQKEYLIRRKIIEFQKVLPRMPKSIREAAGEDPDTYMNGIQSVLRIARNEAGHALSSKPPLREQVYIYLQMFVPFLGYVTRFRHALA
jgi:hypothetical protein